MQAKITLEYSDAKTAEAIARAVSPDNNEAPAGLTVKTECRSASVFTEITYEGKLATFIATIDDLLSSVSTAEKTLQAVGKPSTTER